MTPAERTARSLRTLLARVERDQEAVGAVYGVRPRLLDDDTLADLDLLRRFRHRIRHAYTDPLDRVEMEPVTEAARRVTEAGLPSVVKRLDTSLRAAIDALERE